jgi:hypothetical protein
MQYRDRRGAVRLANSKSREAPMRRDEILTCAFCGSDHVLEGLRLVPEGTGEVMARLEDAASAHGQVRGRLCADCGRLDLRVEHAHELWLAAQRRR